MFETLEMAPADPILGLTEAFRREANPRKVNLGVGIYMDGERATPTLEAVRAAETRMLEADKPKTYLPLSGDPVYGAAVQGLLFGKDSPIVADARARTAHTPGGTGALRVAGDFLRGNVGVRRIHVSDPTWANHPKIFAAAGLEVKTYPYFDASTR